MFARRVRRMISVKHDFLGLEIKTNITHVCPQSAQKTQNDLSKA